LPLHAYLPQDRRRALVRGEALPLRCHGTALFADVSGFTTLTEALALDSGPRRGADELARRINAVHERLIDAVERGQGSVVAFAGDGLVCWFDEAGAGPAAQRALPAAQRALHCAGAMQAAMRAFSGLAVKVGLATGEAMRLIVGDARLQQLDLLAGAPAARAVRGQSLAGAGEVLVDVPTLQALGRVPEAPPRLGPRGETFHAVDALAEALHDRPNGAAPEAHADGQTGARTDGQTGARTGTSPPEPEPDLEALRPWLLPFVLERELAGGGLFATDLRPATAVFVHAAIGTAPLQADGQAPGDAAAPAEAAALARLVERVQHGLHQHGGVLLEAAVDAAGCCLYGNFGAAQVHEDDARRALHAALQLVRELAADGQAVRIGLSSGTLCVGGYGGATRRSFGAIGDEVNTAARLMGLARPGEVLLSGRARYYAADDDIGLEARPPIAMRGKAEPLPVFAVLGAMPRRPIRLHEPSAGLPIVGRRAEIALLAQALSAARSGHGGIVRIVGEPGIGKSRLLAEGIGMARRAGFIGYGGASRTDGVQSPYLVWQGVWAALLELDPALPQRRQQQAVRNALATLVPDQVEAWPLIGALFGHAWPDTPLTAPLTPRDRKSLLEVLLVACLAAAAREAADDGLALLLVLEDLHAADPASLDLLRALAPMVDGLPLLMLTAERPDEAFPPDEDDAAAQDLATLPHTTTIALAGLGSAEVEDVVRAKLALQFPERGGAVPRALIARITAQAQGNPFYLIELLDHLRDRGIDPRQPEAAAAITLPTSLHSLVLSRIDRLSPAQQGVLKAASIIGREFTAAELQGYCPALGSPHEVAQAIARLGQLGFTPPLGEGDAHVFRHVVTREAAYESIGHAARRQLHAQYARHRLAQAGEAVGEAAGDEAAAAPLAPVLAHHFDQAQCADEASHWLLAAAEQAAARYANADALDLLDRALHWLPNGRVARHWDLLLLRQALHDLHGQRGLQRADLDALATLCPQFDPPQPRGAAVARLRARLAIETGDYAAAAAAAAQAERALAPPPGAAPSATPVDQDRLEALLLQAQAHFMAGDAAAARPILARAREQADAAGLHPAALRARTLTGLVHWHEGHYAAAEAELSDALQRARAGTDLRTQINVLNNLGVVAKARARFVDAAAHYGDALHLARRIGDRPGEATLLNNLGNAWLAANRFDEAARQFAQAARMFAAGGEPVQQALALSNLAETHRELGHADEALRLARQAVDLLASSPSPRTEALLRENLGLALRAHGDHTAAAEALQAAARIAREIGAPAREASALLQLARLRAEAGEPAAAAPPLEAARALSAGLNDPGFGQELAAVTALQQAASGAVAEAVQGLDGLLAQLTAIAPAALADAPDCPAPPLWLFETVLQVLTLAGDPRLPAVRAVAQGALQTCALRIADAAARRVFTGQPAYRTIRGDS